MEERRSRDEPSTECEPCDVSNCPSGELVKGDNLCRHEHRRFEHLARFNTRLDEILGAATFAVTESEPGQEPN